MSVLELFIELAQTAHFITNKDDAIKAALPEAYRQAYIENDYLRLRNHLSTKQQCIPDRSTIVDLHSQI